MQVILPLGPYCLTETIIELSLLEKDAVSCCWRALVGELQHRPEMSLQLDHATWIGKYTPLEK